MGPERAAEKRLASLHTRGSGRFEVGSLSSLDGTYVIKSTFAYNAGT